MLRPRDAACTSLLALAVLYTTVLVGFSYRFAHFWGDDLSTFLLVQDRPLDEALFTDLGSQFVPLHRLVNLALQRVAPMSYGAALAVLLVCHLITALYLYRTLASFGRKRLSVLLVSVYMIHPFAGVNFLWFTSGLTRYPYLACSSAALFHYLSFVRRGRFRDLVYVFGLYVLSLGFYSKTILFPLYFAGADVSACRMGLLRAASGTLRARVSSFAVLLLLGAVYCVAVRSGLHPSMARVNSDPGSVSSVIAGTLVAFVQTTLAWELHRELAPLGAWAASVIFLGALYVLLRTERARWPLGVLAVLAALNVAPIAVSSRVLLFGEQSITLDYRYYYEIWFLFVLFGGMALYGVHGTSYFVKRLERSKVLLVALPLALGLHGFESLRGFGFVATEKLWYGSIARQYLTNLETGLARLPSREGPPTFVDGLIPRHLNTLDFTFTHHSHLFRAIGADARFVNRRIADYQVDDDGRIRRNRGQKRIRIARRRPARS